MISLQKKFLFIHVPKTGGNSIQNILRDYSEDEIVTLAKHQDGFERFGVRNSKYNTTKHSTLSNYKAALEAGTYRSLFKFATIRNPWDMMISFYFTPHRGFTEFNRNSFLDLLASVPTLRHYIAEKSIAEKALAKLGVQKSFRNRPIDKDIDFLLRFEHLGDDFKTVCEKIGIRHSALPNRNSSVRSHYSKYYDDELKEYVRNKFIEEIKLGNYTF